MAASGRVCLRVKSHGIGFGGLHTDTTGSKIICRHRQPFQAFRIIAFVVRRNVYFRCRNRDTAIGGGQLLAFCLAALRFHINPGSLSQCLQGFLVGYAMGQLVQLDHIPARLPASSLLARMTRPCVRALIVFDGSRSMGSFPAVTHALLRFGQVIGTLHPAFDFVSHVI